MLHGIPLKTPEERESLDRESLSLYKYILSSHVQILFGNIIIVEKVLKLFHYTLKKGSG